VKKWYKFSFIVSFLILISLQFVSFMGYRNQDINKLLGSQYLSNSQAFLDTVLPQPMLVFATEKNINTLKNEITNILAEDILNYSVSIKDLKTNSSVEINADEIFYPASISKLPIAVLILRDIESGLIKLDDNLVLIDEMKAYDSDILFALPSGTELSIGELLRLMLVESDNTAMMILEELLGGNELVNYRTLNELGVSKLSRYPMETTAREVDKILENIIRGKYLNKELNSLLIQHMSNTSLGSQDRIAKGVPKGIKVAHKIGELVTEYGYVYQDCGIVFAPKGDLSIVVLNRDIDRDQAKEKIREITEFTYTFFENII
jgi:beta-lactamase class A